MGDAADPPIYPRYCFHLAPTVNSWCLMHAVDVHALKQHAGFEGENFYFHKNLPVKWVRIVGVVVAIDEYAGRRIYTVDDSSGACIECMIIIPPPEGEGKTTNNEIKNDSSISTSSAVRPSGMYQNIHVGSVVDVKGGISTFRDEKQITIEKMLALRGTEQEVVLWEKRSRFRKDVLNKPWILRNRDIRGCRKQAEQTEDAAEERKRKRLRATIEHGMVKLPSKPKRA